MATLTRSTLPASVDPICLIVPGLDNSGPEHWQTYWERQRRDCSRIDLTRWSDPDPAVWIERIDRAVAASAAPVLLVAHSLGCIAVALWAQRPGAADKVRGALLVAPPDVERDDMPPPVRRFAPAPRAPLPFASLLVASRNDPYADFAASEAFATAWGSKLVDAGAAGHINASSGLGAWPEGEALIEHLRAATRSAPH